MVQKNCSKKHNVSTNDKWSKTGHESGKLDSEIQLQRRMLHKRWVGRDQWAEKKKIHQIYQNMRWCQLSQCISAHTLTAAKQRESTSSLAVSLETMEPSSFTAGTGSDGVVRKACVSLCLWWPCRGKEVCVRWSGMGGGSPLGRQACGQDRHTERGKHERQGSAIYSQRWIIFHCAEESIRHQAVSAPHGPAAVWP